METNKMNLVKETYEINNQTLAILPAKQIDFDSIVIEQNQTIHVRQTPLQLIDEACYNHDWTTYEGRRQGVMRHTDFKQRVPIPISLHKGIYFFPTHSPKSIDNNWIAWQHIGYITKAPKLIKKKNNGTIIHFKNGQSLQLDVSIHTVESQINRTLECMYRIEMMKKR